MSESSHPSGAISSNLESLILRKVAGVKNGTVAHAIGHDEAHVSRVLSNARGLRLSELQAFFKVLGLSVIESSGPIVQMSSARAEALRTLALEALSRDQP